MNCEQYRTALAGWITGSGDDATELALRGHEHACDACRGRMDAERALHERIARALVAGAETVDPVAVLQRARMRALSADRAAPPRMRILRRVVAGLAASLLVGVTGAWYLCIPPFECPYLHAVEAAVMAPGTTDENGAFDRLAARLRVPDEILGMPRMGDVERIRLDLMGASVPAIRAKYAGSDGRAIVVWTDAAGPSPSFRRKTERAGRTWWIADENECTLVAFRDEDSQSLCTVVSKLPDLDLLRVAEAVRDSSR